MSVAVMPRAGAGQGLREEAREAARVAATFTLVGLVCGWFVVGVLSRLAMFVLAALTPRAAGVTSDDGFTIGQFTLEGSLNLMFAAGTFLGVLGAGLYLAVRPLTIGPPWFRVVSVAVGAGVVVGSQIVHAGGVDFTLLEPLWLAVACFVALPVAYVALLVALGERLVTASWTEHRLVLVAGLLAWLGAFMLLPLLVILALGFLALRAARARAWGRHAVAQTVVPWLLRAALAVVFVLAVVDLVRDVRALS